MAHPFIKHLQADHQKQRSVAEQLKKAVKPKVRSDLREKMSEELLPHMAGEEASIFAYMRGSANAEAVAHAREAIQEHHVARLVLREIVNLRLESEVFSAKATVLAELNEHHMQEEEAEHFPWIEEHATKKQLDELFEKYKAAEKRAAAG